MRIGVSDRGVEVRSLPFLVVVSFIVNFVFFTFVL